MPDDERILRPECPECQPRVDRAVAACLAAADECGGATGRSDYADGFRAAAACIAERIRQLRSGRPLTPLERDLRDAEIESRALGRVVAAAELLVARSDHMNDAGGVRALLGELFRQADLPESLRRNPRDGDR